MINGDVEGPLWKFVGTITFPITGSIMSAIMISGDPDISFWDELVDDVWDETLDSVWERV